MKVLQTFIALLVLCLMANSQRLQSSDHPVKQKPTAFKQVSGLYELEIRLGNTKSIVAGHQWGDKGGQRVITMIRHLYKKESVAIPQSAIGDLCDIKSMKLSASGERAELVLNGADAGSGYLAKIQIIKDEIVSRTVRDGEFPKHFYESTTYVNKAPPGQE